MVSNLATVILGLAAAASALPSNTGFVKPSGQKLVLNGKPFYFAGTNAYWFSFISNITDVSIAMDQAKAAGLNVVRTWGFNDLNVTTTPGGLPQYGGEGAGPSTIYYQSWENGVATINYGENGLKRFDKVVKLAEQKGLKLVVTLTNNWADYGGMDVYSVNLGARYHDEFYTSPKIKTAFKKYVKAVVTRYINSPAIFSWQLANEPRCGADGNRNLPRSPGTTCNVDTITNWANEMSKYIKSLDKNHMVSVGSEGFFNLPQGSDDWAYNGADGDDFDALLKLRHVDYGTFHAYPDWWGKTADWTTQWVLDHGASQKKIGKPVVFEEYGWMTPEIRLQYLGTVSNLTRVDAIGPWQEASLKMKLAGDQFWQLGVDGLSFGSSTNDGFTMFLKSPEAKVLIHEHVKKVAKLNK